MKLIFKIARAEFRSLFYSPVAWFLAIAFLLQCAYVYSLVIEGNARWLDAQIANAPGFTGFAGSITESLFIGTFGVFNQVLTNLYLFLPLLTMGLISKEINSGTIKLLHSSPISTRHIIFGKYIAIMMYNGVLLAILSIFIVSGCLSIVKPDVGILCAALLGFYLLACAYAAIGTFMSSLTTYQIVSAVATFLTFFILSHIGEVWQQYDFVRDLSFFLSMNGRTTKMIAGLITTADVIYFLLIIGMFLSFALFRLKSSTESKAWHTSAVRYLAVVVIVLTLGYITSRPAMIGYWDTSRDKVHTIHPRTQAIIQDFEVDEPLEVTLYVNLLGSGYDRGAPEVRNLYKWNFWDRYVRFKPDIRFNYVYYYDTFDGDSTLYKQYPNKSLKEIAQMTAEIWNTDLSRFMAPEQLRREIDLQPENLRLVMQLKYKGRTTFLRTFDDGDFWPYEINVSAAFKRLQQADMPKVLYTTGDLERSIYKRGEREYYGHALNISNRGALINLGFDPDSINLEKHEVPKGITALVVADPKTALSPLKQEKIRRYLAEGGNAYFLGEPGKQDMLNPLLSDLGVTLQTGTLVEVTKNEMPHMVVPYVPAEALNLSDYFYGARKYLKTYKKLDTSKVLLPGVSEVADLPKTNPIHANSPFKKTVILTTQIGRKTFNKTGKLVTDSVPPVFDPSHGDSRKASYPTLVGLSRKVKGKEQRILVSGDSDFMSTLRGGGGDLTIALFSWLDNNRFPIYTPKNKPLDVFLSINQTGAKLQKILFVWILPSVILLLAIVILIRRKRK